MASLSIERDGKTAIITVRQLPHDRQYKAGDKIKWGSGKAWTVVHVYHESTALVSQGTPSY